MTFPTGRESIAAIGSLTLQVTTDGSGGTVYGIRAGLTDASGGVVRTISLDLQPYLTAGQKNALDNFMAMLRTKATAELLT